MERITIKSLVMEFFTNHPNTQLKTSIVEDWVSEQYFKAHGKYPKGVSTDINQLHHDGRLIKIHQGVYKYDPDDDRKVKLHDFPDSVREEIFKRDNYRCVICGLGREDGVEIAADHKIPRSKNGKNTFENGQTLCNQHNNLKKNYSQTEAGKRYFIKIYASAKEKRDVKMMAFCKSVFDAYDKHDMDKQIARPDLD